MRAVSTWDLNASECIPVNQVSKATLGGVFSWQLIKKESGSLSGSLTLWDVNKARNYVSEHGGGTDM